MSTQSPYDPLRNDADRRDETNEMPPHILERRIMLSIAILGSFTFGFIFFGSAPSILGLLVFFGPLDDLRIIPKILGLAGMVLMGLSIYWRTSLRWLYTATIGTVALFSAWALFFTFAEGNMVSFLGTTPFLFFTICMFGVAIRESGLFAQLNDRLADSRYPTFALQKSRASTAGFRANIIERIKRWLRVVDDDDEKGTK